jgi:hypothetical protein
VAEAAARKAHTLLNEGEDALLAQIVGDESYFSKPAGRGRDALSRDLDCYRGIGDTGHRSSLFGNGHCFPS